MIGRSISRSAATRPGSMLRRSLPINRLTTMSRLSPSFGSENTWPTNGMEGEGDHRAARDLLMAIAPRLRGQMLQLDGEPTLTAAVRIALDLDHSVFPVQGPPGAGKTYTGARMICALAREGKRIGVTANSHKVIRNLLDEVIVAAANEGLQIQCIQKVSDKEDDLPTLRFTTKNEDCSRCAGWQTVQLVEVPLCSGRGPTPVFASTCCLSTKPRRCHLRTC